MKSIKKNPRRSCIESKTKESSQETRLINPRLGTRSRRRVYTEDNSQEQEIKEFQRSPESGAQGRDRGSPESGHGGNAPTFDKGLEERSDMYNISSWGNKGWAPAYSRSTNPEHLNLLRVPNIPKRRRSREGSYRQTKDTIATVNSTSRYDLATNQGRSQLEYYQSKRQKRKYEDELQ